jgi:hypothetical protein
VFELGSECDQRFFGYDLNALDSSAIDWSLEPQWMFDNLWSKYVPIFNAAIAGLKSVYPDASIGIQMAAFGYSPHNDLAISFYESMASAGVAYDQALLSYPYLYPGNWRLPQPYFLHTDFTSVLDRLSAMGKRVQIVEFTYPARPDSVMLDQAVYPCTDEGQATFVREFVKALAGKVDRVNYWMADVFPGINGEGGLPIEAEGASIFASPSSPRPVVASFRRASADRLFDWAEGVYASLFPGHSASVVMGPFYYRYYPDSHT